MKFQSVTSYAGFTTLREFETSGTILDDSIALTEQLDEIQHRLDKGKGKKIELIAYHITRLPFQ